MGKIIFLLAFLLSLAYSQYSVTLEPKIIYDQSEFVDKVYLAKVNIGDQEHATTIFDLASNENFVVAHNCTPPKCTQSEENKEEQICEPQKCTITSSEVTQSVSVLKGNLNLADVQSGVAQVELPHEEIQVKRVSMLLPQEAKSSQLFQELGVQAGLGLGYTPQPSLIQKNLMQLIQEQFGLRNQQVSIYLQSNVPQVIFGKENGFFSDGPKIGLPNTGAVKDGWQIKIDQLGFFNVSSIAHNLFATFDSLTQHYVVSSTIFKGILQTIESAGVKCEKTKSSYQLLLCSGPIDQIPDLVFQIEKHRIAIPASSYFHQKENSSQYYLLMRDTAEDSSQITLGLAFMTKNYVVFRQDLNEIVISNASVFEPQNLILNKPAYISLIVTGIILVTLFLVALSLILKPTPKPTKIAAAVIREKSQKSSQKQ